MFLPLGFFFYQNTQQTGRCECSMIVTLETGSDRRIGRLTQHNTDINSFKWCAMFKLALNTQTTHSNYLPDIHHLGFHCCTYSGMIRGRADTYGPCCWSVWAELLYPYTLYADFVKIIFNEFMALETLASPSHKSIAHCNIHQPSNELVLLVLAKSQWLR